MKKVSFFIALLALVSCSKVNPPEPFGPIPSERQLVWHEMEFYAFVHFNMNTFTDKEWGFGNESPELFNPSELDCRQWASVCKEAGMKGIILTAKHHDGFCLWPSQYTEHSVKNSPWKDGKGDVVGELADACKEYGLKMGIYLSPWDRNHADYGKPEYITYYRNQLRELLTNYGKVFEVWFDGANGGTGYYGGANENRKIDRKTYYDWDNTYSIIRELQPQAVIFSDGGPDIRWVGNEEGWANPTNWCLLRRKEVYPGYDKYKELRSGHEDGTNWVPAECDVSIRPGWYYHPVQDNQVKSLPHLLNIYYQSIGRNASFLLNFPVDHRGLIHENDVKQVLKLAETIEKDFAKNLAREKKVQASRTRGNSRKFSSRNVNDGIKDTYWTTDDQITTANLVIDLGKPTSINRFLVQEYIPLGQRVQQFTVEAFLNDSWQEIVSETTIGYKRILRFATVETDKIRFNITQSKACPVISNIELYNAPVIIPKAEIPPDKKPNILFLFTDDQRFSTINALGNQEVQTPNMDKLVGNGIAFTCAHIMGGTSGAICMPSRAMLLTSKTLFHLERKGASIPDEHIMFPELMREEGYRTFGTGKWHNSRQAYARCFTHGGKIMFGGMSNHLKVPFYDFDPSGEYPKEKQYTGEKFSSEMFVDEAIKFLENNTGDDPFFMYVSFTAPHDPRMAPKEYEEIYPRERILVPENFMPEHPFDNGEMKIRDEKLAPWPRTEEIVRNHIGAYYAMITHADAQIGRLLDALGKSRKSENTIIIFAGDNGLAVGQHGLMGKQNLYEHSIRVPLIFTGPGIPKNVKTDALCYLNDIYPTLCELAGIQIPGTVEGKSLVPLFRKPKKDVRDDLFYAYRNIQRGIRTNDNWKLIAYNVKNRDTTQLFNLNKDPWELNNLANNSKYVEKVIELTDRLKNYMKGIDDPMDLDKENWGKEKVVLPAHKIDH